MGAEETANKQSRIILDALRCMVYFCVLFVAGHVATHFLGFTENFTKTDGVLANVIHL